MNSSLMLTLCSLSLHHPQPHLLPLQHPPEPRFSGKVRGGVDAHHHAHHAPLLRAHLGGGAQEARARHQGGVAAGALILTGYYYYY